MSKKGWYANLKYLKIIEMNYTNKMNFNKTKVIYLKIGELDNN